MKQFLSFESKMVKSYEELWKDLQSVLNLLLCVVSIFIGLLIVKLVLVGIQFIQLCIDRKRSSQKVVSIPYFNVF